MSRCRRTTARYPALATRLYAWRSGRIGRPSRAKPAVSTTASSPNSRAFSPARRYALPACSPAPVTAGTQALARAADRHCSIACGQASGSPTGSPEASATPNTTRYSTAAFPDGDQQTDLSRRSAK